MDYTFEKQESESLEEFLWRLGSMKKREEIDASWDDIAIECNREFGYHYSESYYRKKFKRLVAAFKLPQTDAIFDSELNQNTKDSIHEIEKQKILLRDEKTAYRRTLRNEARLDRFHNDMIEAIKAYEAPEMKKRLPEKKPSKKAIYVLLSDIHYGLKFENIFAKYNEDIAIERLAKYASSIIDIAQANNIDTCYISLLGDLISGNIHPMIKVENQEDLIQQTIGVAEMLSEFIQIMGDTFSEVHVNDVAGNHSRLDGNPDNVSRTERLDLIIPWYCEARLANYKNVHFLGSPEKSVTMFKIFDKNYIAVHGDFDGDLKISSARLADAIGCKVDYIVAGHLHVPKMTFESTGLIQNGAVVTGGDEYTVKKRLFGPAFQVAMIVSPEGVEAVYPVRLV